MLKKFEEELAKIIFEFTESNNEYQLNDDEVKYNNETLAIVPGSFKPPHKGHWEMIMKYVNKVDKVIIIISNISTKAISNRPLSLTNLKHFGKIKQFAIDNNILNEKIENIFSDVESLGNDINFENLKKILEKLIISSKEVKDIDIKFVKKFQLMIQTYLNKLNETLFKSIRKAGEIEITPEISKEIFEIFAKAYGVENKVDIIIPDSASPISTTVAFINYYCKNCEILLGVSKKGGDDSRWNGIEKSIKNETVKVIPSPIDVKTMISATDLRNNIYNLQKDYFPEKISEDDFNKIKKLLIGEDDLNEKY